MSNDFRAHAARLVVTLLVMLAGIGMVVATLTKPAPSMFEHCETVKDNHDGTYTVLCNKGDE